ncbi:MULTISPECIES: hypothetical protein [Bacteria]|nr:hypothetical protein [Sulfolobus islandicus]
MKIFTFVGFTKHLDELDFDYVVVDKTFNDITEEQIKKYQEKIIWNETNTDIRWLRIAKQLLTIVNFAKNIEDDIIAIIDSDLIIPNLRQIIPNERIFIPCYWLYYSWANEIRPFCSGTNYIFRKSLLPYLEYTINTYIENEYYKEIPVDIFIHNFVPHMNILKLGTIHYVKTPDREIKMEFRYEDIPQIFKHIPEFVLLIG